MAGEHRWKLSWPGNFCLDCGLDDPLESEDALVDCPHHEQTEAAARDCKECAGTGCVVDPNLVVPPCPGKAP